MRAFFACVLMTGLWVGASARAAYEFSNTDVCVSNPDMALADYVARARPLAGISFKELPDGDYRSLVPKDLKVQNGAILYFVSASAILAESIDLPTHIVDLGRSQLKYPFSFTSPCRVQDAQGKWWAVYRTGRLSYVPLEDLVTEADNFLPDKVRNQSYRWSIVGIYRRPPGRNTICTSAQRSLADLMAITNDVRAWKLDDFKKTPRGLFLENKIEDYVAVRAVETKVLPDPNAQPLADLEEGAQITSLCHVRDDSGAWWAAVPDKDGFMVYVPLDGLRPAGKNAAAR